ncbi:hypothetical protein GF326_00465 [Candidatus Bathyarchaeota archaeon]|nr:hypothetical protein [Candidatus Bathyarchaeota archaeon]
MVKHMMRLGWFYSLLVFFGELKHGTIALIEENIPGITLSSTENQDEIISNAMEIKEEDAFSSSESTTRTIPYSTRSKYPTQTS